MKKISINFTDKFINKMVETIQQQLADRGLKRVRVRGDGNCQFRAVAASFANTKLNARPSHRTLRKEAVEYIARHHTHYKDFIWDQSFEDFLRNIRISFTHISGIFYMIIQRS